MKKIAFLAIALVALTTACKKDYSCNCTESYTYDWDDPSLPNTTGTANYTVSISNERENDAEDRCSDYEENYTERDNFLGSTDTYTTVCNLTED